MGFSITIIQCINDCKGPFRADGVVAKCWFLQIRNNIVKHQLFDNLTYHRDIAYEMFYKIACQCGTAYWIIDWNYSECGDLPGLNIEIPGGNETHNCCGFGLVIWTSMLIFLIMYVSCAMVYHINKHVYLRQQVST